MIDHKEKARGWMEKVRAWATSHPQVPYPVRNDRDENDDAIVELDIEGGTYTPASGAFCIVLSDGPSSSQQ